MKIDPHVHCRDGQESYKETIAHVFTLCDQQGVDMIFDMPNTSPPLLAEADLERRLALVPRAARGRYKTFIGATADPDQLRQATELARTHHAEVAGLKLYAGPSVGSLAVSDTPAQALVYRVLTECGYTGVLAVHCEKAALLRKIFDPAQPGTHGAARPPAAEVASINDQVDCARAAGFRGTLHICHVSSAAALDAIRRARQAAPGPAMAITCGVTPHHLLWSEERMREPAGLLYKVNPPLRPAADTAALRNALKLGEINWIESDHAPHALCEKLFPPYASGFPSLCLYRRLVGEMLPAWGLDTATINKVTGGNIRQVFQMEP